MNMKLNKIFAFATVLVLALTGCNQAIEREPSPEFPTDVKDVYFPTIDERGTEIDPSAGVYTHTVTIARKDSTGALTVALNVIVNNEPITLTGKSKYVFVDVFDFIDFDTRDSRGRAIVTNINGKRCGYSDRLKTGDKIDIYWQDLK